MLVNTSAGSVSKLVMGENNVGTYLSTLQYYYRQLNSLSQSPPNFSIKKYITILQLYLCIGNYLNFIYIIKD